MKKILIGIIIFLIPLSVFLFLNREVISSLNSLRNTTINNIAIEGTSYRLDNGKIYEKDKELFWFIPSQKEKIEKVLSLSGFYMWNKEDPLFYSPDLNVTEFAKTALLLENEQKALLQAFKQTVNLYPAGFISQFAKTAALSQDFLQNPSMDKTTALIKAQKKTAELYKKEASALKSFIPPTDSSPVLFNTQTTNKIVLADLSKIEKNSEAILKEINQREDCLKGKKKCMRPSASFEKPLEAPKIITVPPDTLLDPNLVYYQQADNTSGPYSTNTACFGWGDKFIKPLNYLYLKRAATQKDVSKNQIPNLSYLNIQLATDILFRKVLPDSKVAGEKELYDQGLKYLNSGTTAPYECPDRSFFAETAELDIFIKNNKPILQDIKLPDSSFKTFEKSFFEQKYPSFQTLSYLSDIYGYLYRQMEENPGTDWAIKLQPHKDELLNRHLSIKNKLGNAHLVFNSHINFIRGLTARQEIEQRFEDSYVKEFVYTFRNFYGLVYLPFTPSVWRVNESLDYLAKVKVVKAVDPEGFYISYHQAVKLYPMEEIEKWLSTRRVIK